MGPRAAGLQLQSPLGMGLWAWGDSLVGATQEERVGFTPRSHALSCALVQTWGYGTYDAALSATTMREAFAAARGAGVSLFDTAEVGHRAHSRAPPRAPPGTR